jgi:ubiquinol-cytochrome c reductase cytochrome b subunit
MALASGGAFLVVVFALLGVSLWNLHTLPKTDPSVARGKEVFAQQHCMACHRIHGDGGMVGPDLSYVADHRPDRQWHLQHFRNPQSVSPGSIMPAFALDEKPLNDLISYMLSLKSGASAGGAPRSAHHKGRTTDDAS